MGSPLASLVPLGLPQLQNNYCLHTMRCRSGLRPAALATTILYGFTICTAQTITITAAPAATGDFMSELINGAKSLLDSIYPEISQYATVTLPATVVIDGSTYHIPDIIFPTPTQTSSSTSSSPSSSISSSNTVSSTSTDSASITSSTSSSTPPITTSATPAQTTSMTSSPASTLATQTVASNNHPPSSTSSANSKDSGKKRLGIVLGAVFGFVALALLALLIFLIHLRRVHTGHWLKHQKMPSDEEINAWHSDGDAAAAAAVTVAAAEKSAEEGKRNSRRYSWAHGTPLPIVAEESGESANASREAMGGYHPHEAEDAALMTVADGPYARADRASNRRSGSYSDDRVIDPVPDPYEASRQQRSQTPLMHGAFAAAARDNSARSGSMTPRKNSIPRKPVAPVLAGHPGQVQDPFASPHDRWGPSTPTLPVRSPDRRSRGSGVYPSPPEADGFDFGLGNERRRSGGPGSGGRGVRREWDYGPVNTAGPSRRDW